MKERPDYLEQAFKSILWQTVLPTEVILIEDGILTEKLYKRIEAFEKRLKILNVFLNIIKNKSNMGLGFSLQKGVKACRYKYIARMDTDDVAFPNRFERQLDYLIENQDIDILGTNSIEFTENDITTVQSNVLPEKHNEIIEYMKFRNPISHPTVMFKRQVILDSGGYRPFQYFEDYYLWTRCAINNAKFHNLTDKLLMSRVNPKLYSRRGGIKYIKTLWRFRIELRNLNIINFYEMVESFLVQGIVSLLPNIVREFIYEKLLRKRSLGEKIPVKIKTLIYK